jgi:L-aminopeptidase/D-esterase-like protein
MRNLITDIDGLKVGNAQDHALKSGVTVLYCEAPFVASAHIMGGAPGTVDTELLNPDQTVPVIDAIVLAGGSAFGLDAAGGVRDGLAGPMRGYHMGGTRIPIVSGAILFDLNAGGDKDWGARSPYYDLGRQALEAVSMEFDLGSAGAGTGALLANLKGGLGSASCVLANGTIVGALVAVNSVGQVTLGDSCNFWAAPFEIGDEFGGLGWPAKFLPEATRVRTKMDALADRANTAIAVVATDAALTKAQAKRLAIMAHDGVARAVWPAHTPFDGDLVFVASTGSKPLADPGRDMVHLGAAAASTLSRAIARGVYEATTAPGDMQPTWRDRFGSRKRP